MIDWINAGQLQIARETKCLSTTSSAVANLYPFAMPTNLLKIERITYDGVALNYVDIEELDSRILDLSIVEAPLLFYVVGQTIHLYPKPAPTDNTTVVLTYSRIPVTIATIADSLTLPEAFHQDLVDSVLINAHERNENWKAVEILTNKLLKNLSLRVEDSNVPDDTYPIIRDDGIYGYELS